MGGIEPHTKKRPEIFIGGCATESLRAKNCVVCAARVATGVLPLRAGEDIFLRQVHRRRSGQDDISCGGRKVWLVADAEVSVVFAA